MKNKGEFLTWKNIRFSPSTSAQIVYNLYGSFRSSRDFCGELNSQNICKHNYYTLGADVHQGFLASKADGSFHGREMETMNREKEKEKISDGSNCVDCDSSFDLRPESAKVLALFALFSEEGNDGGGGGHPGEEQVQCHYVHHDEDNVQGLRPYFRQHP